MNCQLKDTKCSFCKEKEEVRKVAVKAHSEKGSRCISIEGLCYDCLEAVKPLILETRKEKDDWLYGTGLQEEI